MWCIMQVWILSSVFPSKRTKLEMTHKHPSEDGQKFVNSLTFAKPQSRWQKGRLVKFEAE